MQVVICQCYREWKITTTSTTTGWCWLRLPLSSSISRHSQLSKLISSPFSVLQSHSCLRKMQLGYFRYFLLNVYIFDVAGCHKLYVFVASQQDSQLFLLTAIYKSLSFALWVDANLMQCHLIVHSPRSYGYSYTCHSNKKEGLVYTSQQLLSSSPFNFCIKRNRSNFKVYLTCRVDAHVCVRLCCCLLNYFVRRATETKVDRLSV